MIMLIIMICVMASPATIYNIYMSYYIYMLQSAKLTSKPLMSYHWTTLQPEDHCTTHSRYLAVTFVAKRCKRRPIAHPLEGIIRCLLWVQSLVNKPLLSLLCFIQQLAIMDCQMSAINSTYYKICADICFDLICCVILSVVRLSIYPYSGGGCIGSGAIVVTLTGIGKLTID